MKVLLVENDLNYRANIVSFLKAHGCVVDEADNGKDALKNFLINLYQIVLANVDIPIINGIELLKTISTSPYWNSADIVLYAEKGDSDTVIQALRLGAFDFMLKPLKKEELLRILEKVTKRRISNRKKCNILMVHQDSLFSEGLKYILTQINNYNLVGEAGNLHQALCSLKKLRTNLILIDWNCCAMLEQENLIEVIGKKLFGIKVVFLHYPEDYIGNEIKQYAAGFIPKNAGAKEVIAFLQHLEKGYDVSGIFTSTLDAEADNKLAQLTPIEQQILCLLGQGLSNKEIAEDVYLGYSTVRTYVSRIYEKLELANRAEAAVFAVKHLDNLNYEANVD